MTLDTAEKRHNYWRDPANSGFPKPWIAGCKPEFYLGLLNVTKLVIETIDQYAKPEMSILEIGCGTGRNLAGLYEAGFTNVEGIEINPNAVKLGRKAFPALENIPITVASIEEAIKDIPQYDVIFTQGVLMHLPPDTEWVIDVLCNKARKLLVLIEGEHAPSFDSWPHDYQALVEYSDKWRQVEMQSCEAYPPLPKTTIKRVFKRKRRKANA
jgi:SAM-dependent methyltransferase